MPGKQAPDGRRAQAFTFAPDELTLITDPKDPLFDKRVYLPIDRGMVLSVAAQGVIEPIGARRRDEESVVVFGKQRTKATTVANQLGAGVEYLGTLKPILEALAEFGADETFVGQLRTLMGGKAIRIPAVGRNAGEDSDARSVMRIENAHRQGDPVRERIRAAQLAVEKHGDSPEDIARDENVDVKTVKRWLAMDVSNGVRKPKRGLAKGPSKAKLKTYRDHKETPKGMKVFLGWLIGENTREEMLNYFPDMGGIV